MEMIIVFIASALVFLIPFTAAIVVTRLQKKIGKHETQSQFPPQDEGAQHGVMTMTTATASVSTHPLAGQTSKFKGIVGLIFDLMVAVILANILTGRILLSRDGFDIVDMKYPWELAAPIAAYAFYRIDSWTSRQRPRTWGWGLVDLVGTGAVIAVLVIAAASWIPQVGDFLAANNLPVVPRNGLTTTIVASFSVAIGFHWRKYHIRRAEVGLEAVEAENVVAPGVTPALPTRHAESGAGATIYEGPVTITYHVQNMVVAEPGQAVKFRFSPKVVAGRDYEEGHAVETA